MEWIERLNNAINYIEEHLEDEVNYEEIASSLLKIFANKYVYYVKILI